MTPKNIPGKSTFKAFILHLHPPAVPVNTLRFRLSFGLGGMSATLCAVLVVTGILQLLSYSAQTTEAYVSIQQMYAPENPAGFFRNIHYWSGNLLIIIAFLHQMRVFLTGATNGIRAYNWLVGSGLMLLVLFANFTGYLMPWDQRAYWAVTIFTSMFAYIPFVGEWLAGILRGGLEVGPQTLANFFAIHIGIIPSLMIFLMIWHFWLIRKAGGLVQGSDNEDRKKRVPTIPHLIQREIAVALILLALIGIIAALFDAPLGAEANPGQSPNPTKAAWYFMGLQELLLHLHPFYAICIVPTAITAGFMMLPFIKDASVPGGVWFGGRKGFKTALVSLCAGFIVTMIAVIGDEIITDSTISQATLIGRGIVPTVIYGLLLAGTYYFLKKRTNGERPDAVMGVVMFVCGSILSLTATGIWLRGPEMVLMFPGL